MLSPIPEILQELADGRMVVLVDDENRENEGDLILPAEKVTPEAINFMPSTARGYMCLSLTEADCDRLDLGPQTSVNTSVRGTPFTVSIDGAPKHGFTTGVSAFERAKTIRLAIDPKSGPDDFVRPGHINPLRSRDGGVLVRTGQTEGSIDLCRLAGVHPSAVIIEIMRDDGEMARVPDLEKLCVKHNLKMCSVAQIIQYRIERETLIHRLDLADDASVENAFGRFGLLAYESVVDALPHVVLTTGDVGRVEEIDEPVLVRMHQRRLLGDVFDDFASSPEGSTRRALEASMRAIQEAEQGAIVYLRPEGAGDGLDSRLLAIKRPDRDAGDAPDLTIPSTAGGSAVPPEMRQIGVGGQILRDLGIRKIRLLTNHPRALPGLEGFGLEIVEHVALQIDERVH
jgi:3,4-dihydroxy 2-butanone 4-phosphate synthase/GTP cyclohydrolase II